MNRETLELINDLGFGLMLSTSGGILTANILDFYRISKELNADYRRRAIREAREELEELAAHSRFYRNFIHFGTTMAYESFLEEEGKSN